MVWWVPVVLALLACSSPPPSTPRPAASRDPAVALGDTSEESPPLRRALDARGFARMGEPQPGDWLTVHPEPGQTFAQWEASYRPDPARRTLYVLPLGEFPDDAPSIPSLVRVVRAFYGIDVVVLPAIDVARVVAHRRGDQFTLRTALRRCCAPAFAGLQLLAPEVLEWLAPQVPPDALALLAITMTDLYPSDSWNYVFGLASLTTRVSVQSFARQDRLRPAMWTMIHETGHTFGLRHCIYYECVFSGANHQDEVARRPLHACPVCTRKLHAALDFDPAAREDRIADMFRTLDVIDEAQWSEARARWIRSAR